MRNPFKFLGKKIFPSYLGVDIGTTSIKIAEVKQGEQLPRMVNYGFLESRGHLLRSNDVLQTSSLKLFEEEAMNLIKALVKEMKPTTDQVLASLPVFSAFMTVLNFPEMPPKDLDKAIALQAGQYVPLPISEVALDWIKVGEYKDDKGYKNQQILLISVAQEQIRRYQRLFKSIGLNLRGLEIESLALIRALVGTDPTPTALVDIGSRSTNIVFAEDSQLKFGSQSDFASASLTQALTSSLNINALRAEELKRERGVSSASPDYELSTIMLPFLDVIINEVKKAEFNYHNQFSNARKIERVILSGGGANLIGIEKYFQREFLIPVIKASPFLKFEYPPSIEPLVAEVGPILSVALGLTLKEFI